MRCLLASCWNATLDVLFRLLFKSCKLTHGSVLGTAVNCAVMALMDAGIAMRGLAVAATCIAINNISPSSKAEDMDIDASASDDTDVTIWLDPTVEE